MSDLQKAIDALGPRAWWLDGDADPEFDFSRKALSADMLADLVYGAKTRDAHVVYLTQQEHRELTLSAPYSSFATYSGLRVEIVDPSPVETIERDITLEKHAAGHSTVSFESRDGWWTPDPHEAHHILIRMRVYRRDAKHPGVCPFDGTAFENWLLVGKVQEATLQENGSTPPTWKVVIKLDHEFRHMDGI